MADQLLKCPVLNDNVTGFDGRPHPDNADHEKYTLCVDGITQLKANCASILPFCYVWLDFGCINQNGNPAGELKQLDKIVQSSDCIFTPIGKVGNSFDCIFVYEMLYRQV